MRTYTADEVDEMIGRALAREREREQRKPLTDKQIDECWYQSGGLSVRFARAIEAAHGIGEKPDAA